MNSEVTSRLVRSVVDVSRAAQVFGWMSGAELEWLGKQALDHLVIVELGSYLGRSTRALGDNTLGKVYAVDDWMGADTGDYERPLTAERSNQMYEEFRVNVADLIEAGIVVPCKLQHGTESNALDLTPDMVFIDGDHSYEACRRDIQTWWPRLAPGGLLCGHDSLHAPVTRAVNESLASWSTAKETTIWYSIKGEKQ